MTGMDPGGDGMFDFILRDPKTMTLLSSMADVDMPSHTVSIGPYCCRFPKDTKSGFFKAQLSGRFWIRSAYTPSSFACPIIFLRCHRRARLFPAWAHPIYAGRMVPSPTSRMIHWPLRMKFRGALLFPVTVNNNQVPLVVGGPENTLRKDHARSTVTMVVHRDPDHPAALFEVDGQKFILRQGEWSGWIHV